MWLFLKYIIQDLKYNEKREKEEDIPYEFCYFMIRGEHRLRG